MADKASDKAQDRGGKLPLAKKNAWGYDTEQVDEFLSRAHQLYEAPQPQLKQEDIQNVLFTLVRGGYDIDAVDRALLRLEQAAVDKQTSYQIANQGRVAWRTETVQLAQTLMPRALADDGERFADGQGKEPSYDRKQVDSFVVNVMTRICDELGIPYRKAVSSSNFDSDEDFVPRYISTVLFTQRKGDKGYDEGQVDLYLNRVSQVVSRIVSFSRLEGVPVKSTMEGGQKSDRLGGSAQEQADYQAVASMEESLFPQNQASSPAQGSQRPHEQQEQQDGQGQKGSSPVAPERVPVTPSNNSNDEEEPVRLSPYEGAMPISFAPSASQRVPAGVQVPHGGEGDSQAAPAGEDPFAQLDLSAEREANYQMPDLVFPSTQDAGEAQESARQEGQGSSGFPGSSDSPGSADSPDSSAAGDSQGDQENQLGL
ncbi:MAG: DivIVA domain-containing protein [Parascardovia denticolens]